MRRFYLCAALALMVILVAAPARSEWHVIRGMEKVEAKQRSEVWCWAAALVTSARASRVSLTQEEVVADAKGRVVFETASYNEITQYLQRGWRGAPGNPSTWTVDTLAFEGAAQDQGYLRYFQIGRPVIVAYQTAGGTGHAVVAFGGDFEGNVSTGDDFRMVTIRLFDPADGSSSDEDWSSFRPTIIGTWLPTIIRRDGCNVFGPNGPPPGCAGPVQGSGVPMPPKVTGGWCNEAKNACLFVQSLDGLLFRYDLGPVLYIGYARDASAYSQIAVSTEMVAINPATGRGEGPKGRLEIRMRPDGQSLNTTFSYPGLDPQLSAPGPLYRESSSENKKPGL